MLCAGAKMGADGLATAAMLAALLEEPPRSGQMDIGYWLGRPQPHWQRRAAQLSKRLLQKSGQIDADLAAPLLAQAFADRIAQRRGQDGRYLLANGLGAAMDQDEALSRAPWLIIPSLLQGHNSPDARILLALPIEIDALVARLPEIVSNQTAVEWDEEKGTLRAWKRQQIGRLTLRAQPLAKPAEEELQQALINWVRAQGLAVLNWDIAAEQLRLRLHCAQRWLPEAEWPPVDDETLLDTLESWLLPSLSGVRDLRGLKQVNIAEALARRLDWQQKQRLDNALPTHYAVPTGSRLPIRYDADKPPVLAVRLQEMFGEQRSPTLAEGRIPVVLELLSGAPAIADHRRSGRLLARRVPRGAKGNEGALSQARMARRPGQYRPPGAPRNTSNEFRCFFCSARWLRDRLSDKITDRRLSSCSVVTCAITPQSLTQK